MAILKGEIREPVGVVAVLVQGAQGSPSAPTAANGFWAFDIDVVPVPELNERLEQAGFMGSPEDPKIGNLYRQLTFKTLLKGWGTSYGDAPCELHDALRACMLGSTEDSTNQTYQYDPIGSSEVWSTFYVYWDGLLHKLTDCQGNVKITGETGKPLVAEFTMSGLWVDMSDAEIISPSALHSTIPPVMKSATVQMGSDTLPIAAFELDAGNNVSSLVDPAETHGIRSFKITNRKPVGSFDPEMTLVATFDWETIFLNQTAQTLTIELDGGTGNKITIYAPKMQIAGLTPSSRGEIRTYTIPVNFKYSSGDDEWYLKYSHS